MKDFLKTIFTLVFLPLLIIYMADKFMEERGTTSAVYGHKSEDKPQQPSVEPQTMPRVGIDPLTQSDEDLNLGNLDPMSDDKRLADDVSSENSVLPPLDLTVSGWSSNWGSDIKAHILTSECTVASFRSEGYQYGLYIDIPASRVSRSKDAWGMYADRAITVTGCWLMKKDGRQHIKYVRKKDQKVSEQDINLQDGTWAGER